MGHRTRSAMDFTGSGVYRWTVIIAGLLADNTMLFTYKALFHVSS